MTFSKPSKTFLALAVSGFILGMAGCGGGSDSTAPTTPTSSLIGAAVDPYLEGCAVSYKSASGDTLASSVTGTNGSYSITNGTINGGYLEVSGGASCKHKKSKGDETYTGTLQAPVNAGGTANITPLTTLLKGLIDSGQATDINTAKSLLAVKLGIDPALLDIDPMTNATTAGLSAALGTMLVEMQKSGVNFGSLVSAIATKIAEGGVVDAAQLSSRLVEIVKAVAAQLGVTIDTSNLAALIDAAKNDAEEQSNSSSGGTTTGGTTTSGGDTSTSGGTTTGGTTTGGTTTGGTTTGGTTTGGTTTGGTTTGGTTTGGTTTGGTTTSGSDTTSTTCTLTVSGASSTYSGTYTTGVCSIPATTLSGALSGALGNSCSITTSSGLSGAGSVTMSGSSYICSGSSGLIAIQN